MPCTSRPLEFPGAAGERGSPCGGRRSEQNKTWLFSHAFPTDVRHLSACQGDRRRLVAPLARACINRATYRNLEAFAPFRWCCRWVSNLRPLPYQGSALPLTYGSLPAWESSPSATGG